jgi:hypothetical protein
MHQLREFTEKYLKNAQQRPGLIVVNEVADLPFDAPDDIPGAYFKGGMYLNTGNVDDAAHAREVIAHEIIGHFGLNGFFGTALNHALYVVHNKNLLVQRYTNEWITGDLDVIKKLNLNAKEIHYRAIVEAMARMAQEGLKSSSTHTLLLRLQE